MRGVVVLATVVGVVFAQYEDYNANFGRSASHSCQISNGGIYIDGKLKRMMTSNDVATLNDYNNKVENWKYGLRDTILAALPFNVEPGQPVGLSEWPFGPSRNPFDVRMNYRKRRDIGRFPDAPSFCNPDQ